MQAFTRRPKATVRLRLPHAAHQFTLALLTLALMAQSVWADPITYKQLRQDASSRTAPAPAQPATPNVTRANDRTDARAAGTQQPQSPVAKESPNHPEFVRLPDGRIVRYGPGILCEENCAEPAAPAAFREGSRLWWIIPPIIAGGILCAVLCRPGDDKAQPTPTIIIPQPTMTPVATPTASVAPTTQPSPGPTSTPPQPTPTVAPTVTPTPPPPNPIPEPGTVALFGLGLSALVARHRRKKNQRTED